MHDFVLNPHPHQHYLGKLSVGEAGKIKDEKQIHWNIVLLIDILII